MPDPTGLLIRAAVADDLPRLVELLIGGALVDGKEDPGDLAPYAAALDEITASPGELLVAEEGGVVVGTCQLLVFRHLQAHGGRCAEIESMHVDPARRGEGIGGRLLQAAVERAHRLGCYRVQLTSNKARTDAHRFYDRHGFAATHEGFKRPLGEPGPPATGSLP